ncbi:PAS domain S-box protein [Haloprofundus sp. MHR1]|uniref:PAS domain S-box protein n=1 Tax=Haloprofundus sp. MHR1 TaxID=2572921 RepID=UPI0010BE7382|nr:PAS domain S-box protein [Haloprofundus sp. MHR1]QCJ45979.1 PAS domain S-box protein [Haloprofundus sp. MHR1]
MPSNTEIRLLLIDDNSDFLELLQILLEQTNQAFEFTTETDPQNGIARFESTEDIDCILCDYHMPEMDGIEVLETIRATNTAIPFILLTSAGSEEIASRAVNTANTGYLKKDVRLNHVDRIVETVTGFVHRYRQQQRLEENLTVIDRLFGSIDDVVYVTDLDGQPQYWNDAITSTTGYTDADVQTLTPSELFPASQHERVQESLSTALEEEPPRLEVDLLTKDGTQIPFEFSRSPFCDEEGNVIGICGVGRDISDRKQYERALRGLHTTTRNLLEATSREEIAEIVAMATKQVVDNPVSTVQLIEGDRLLPVGVPDETKAVFSTLPDYSINEDAPVSRVYRSGVSEHYTRVEDIDDGRDRGKLKQVYYYPLGEHGTLNVGLTENEPFSKASQQLAEILAANGTAALNQLKHASDLRTRERMLKTLHETTRELMQARTPESIAETAVNAAANILELPAVTVFLWDDDTASLCPTASTDDTYELFDEIPTFSTGDSIAWDVFIDGETRVVENVSQNRLVYNPETDIETELYVPLGEYGLLLSGATEQGIFDDSDVEFAEL